MFLLVVGTGCATHTVKDTPIEVAPVHVEVASIPSDRAGVPSNALGDAILKKTFGSDTVAGQLFVGCAAYLRSSGRWPHTKEEIAAGLASENARPNRLSEVKELILKEEQGSLLVEFVSVDAHQPRGTVRGSIKLSKQTKPNQPLVPTRGNAPSSAGAPQSGAAHL